MNEYYLHDKTDGDNATAMQKWRDAHTVDSLASKIRTYLQGLNGGSLFTINWHHDLAVQP